jgi:ribulose-5-phosphate 4-epimerase/fuculose-1-phosphate aldolase
MARDVDSTDGAEEKEAKKGPPKGPPGSSPKGPPSGPPSGMPMGMPMGMFPGMTPPGAAPPQRSSPSPQVAEAEEPSMDNEEESEPEVEETPSDDDTESTEFTNIQSDAMGDMIGKAIAQTPMSEVEALRYENESLRSAVTGATGIIEEMDTQPMPPIVGDGFIVPAHVVGDFVRIGRQLQREGLCHATSGSISILSLDEPNLVHMTRQGSSLGQLDERHIVSGRLGEQAPPGAGDTWRIHTILLAVASLEHNGRAACAHLPAPYSTAMSLEQDLFVLRPVDSSGKERFDSVVIVDSDDVTEDDFLRQLSEGLQQSNCKAIVVRGGGIYAVGADFNDAWDNAAAIEHSMKISYLIRLADIDN